MKLIKSPELAGEAQKKISPWNLEFFTLAKISFKDLATENLFEEGTAHVVGTDSKIQQPLLLTVESSDDSSPCLELLRLNRASNSVIQSMSLPSESRMAKK